MSEFFEAGLNLTDLGFGGSCFSTFTGVTRSSMLLTATIFDYSLGTLGDCTSGIDTTPSTGSDLLVTPGTSVHDNGTITVSGIDGTFGGTVSFYLCGPTTGSAYVLCETGGTVVNGTEAGALNAPVAAHERGNGDGPIVIDSREHPGPLLLARRLQRRRFQERAWLERLHRRRVLQGRRHIVDHDCSELAPERLRDDHVGCRNGAGGQRGLHPLRRCHRLRGPGRQPFFTGRSPGL